MLRTFVDQTDQEVNIDFPPQRIISLVPSQTELLADLNVSDKVIGITRFCVHPDSWRQSKIIIGGTKNFHFNIIKSLTPDLIIGNKEENYKEGIEQLKSIAPVWMSDIVTFDDALSMIKNLGLLTSSNERADEIITQIQYSFKSIQKLPPLRAAYLIWRKPWMVAASITFINEMMGKAGLLNCFDNHERYPELSDEELKNVNPELVLLSSEPYPFQQKHIKEVQQLCPQARIKLVDGEMFSWYGSRLVQFPQYINSFKNPLT